MKDETEAESGHIKRLATLRIAITRRRYERLGEDVVRMRLNAGQYSEDEAPYVKSWLSFKQLSRQDAMFSENVRLQRIAIYIAAIAAVAAITSTMMTIYMIISGNP